MLVQQQKAARPLRISMRRRAALTGYLFIMPVILGYLIWVAGPLLVAVWLSLNEWDMLRPAIFVGLDNYQLMFQDDLFWKSLAVTFYFTLVSVPLSLVISFAVALLVNVNVRGIAIFRTLFYLPSIVPLVVNAVLWIWIFNSELGCSTGCCARLVCRRCCGCRTRTGPYASADPDEPVGHRRRHDHLPGRAPGHPAASV